MTISRPVRRALIAAVVVTLVSAGWTVWRLLAAKDHLDVARGQLTTARDQLLDRDLDAAARTVARSSQETGTANDLAHDPITWAWSHVPLLGRAVTVARDVSSVADQTARTTLPLALDVAREIDPDRLRTADGRIDTSLLVRAAPDVDHAADVAERGLSLVRATPSTLLPDQVAAGRRDFVEQLDELTRTLRNASDAVALAPSFLGAGQPRRWFVAVQQNGESRGTGGIIGGYAVLETRDGRLTVAQQGSNAALRSVHVDGKGVPDDYRARYELDGAFDIWPNINLSPDLPVVAKVIEAKWVAQGGKPLDGVIALDAQALALLLRGGAPIAVPSGQVPAEQLVEFLSVGQYRGVDVGPTGVSSRKDLLSEIARQVLGRLVSGGGGDRELLRGLVEALRSGHVHVASDDPTFSSALSRSGLDGGLPDGAAPVAYPVVNNASGGKLDYYLDRELRYEGGGCDGETRDTTITVTLRNSSPPLASLPEYVARRSSEGGFGSSDTGRVLLEVYGTRGAALISATLNGQAVSTVEGRTQVRLQAATEDGLPVWQVPVDTPRDQTVTLVLHLQEPTVAGAARVPEQPLARLLLREVSLPTC